MGFEYDPDKSADSKRKHGIDFEVAQRLWADAGLVESPLAPLMKPVGCLLGRSTISIGPRYSLGAARIFD
jgi:hypothetical protein